MKWTEFLNNSTIVSAIFQEYTPTLNDITLIKIEIETGGRCDILLKFDLMEFPKKPPKKWLDNQANTVQVHLNIWAATILYLKITKKNCVGNLLISRGIDKLVIIEMMENNISIFKIEATYLHIAAITGYCNEK